MVNSVNGAGYQAYAPQQAVTAPVEVPRSGENRIQVREAPAADSQRADSREFASRNDGQSSAQKSANDDGRGTVVDITV
jgi:hypothetical protein